MGISFKHLKGIEKYISPGDEVEIIDIFGKECKGKVVFSQGVILGFEFPLYFESGIGLTKIPVIDHGYLVTKINGVKAGAL